jgi:hypothetical protein
LTALEASDIDPRLCLTLPQAKAKDRALQKQYGISLMEYTAVLEYQRWRCPVCGIGYQACKRWCVDHEHRKGLEGPVRGILDLRCNLYRVSKLKLPEVEKIYAYMMNPPATIALGGERIASPTRKKKIRRRRSRSK